MANLDSLFSAWLEGESLTDEQIALLQANAEYALMMSNAMQWQQQSQNYETVSVPNWDRESSMPKVQKSNLFFGSGMWAVAASIAFCAWLFDGVLKMFCDDYLKMVCDGFLVTG